MITTKPARSYEDGLSVNYLILKSLFGDLHSKKPLHQKSRLVRLGEIDIVKFLVAQRNK